MPFPDNSLKKKFPNLSSLKVLSKNKRTGKRKKEITKEKKMRVYREIGNVKEENKKWREKDQRGKKIS